MDNKDLEILIEELRALPKESEWVEFKVNKAIPQDIGEYISGLSNAACLEGKEHAYPLSVASTLRTFKTLALKKQKINR